MVVPHFKIEMQASVLSAIRSQKWTVSIDIRDVYLHVPMHQSVRKYLWFVVNKQVYQFNSLPFGLATSLREITKLLRPVVLLLRQRGVKLHVYLDDWLIHADSPEKAQPHAQTTISVLQFLGWIINYEKSDLTQSQDFQFIGMQFNTRQFTVVPLPTIASQSPVRSPTLDDQSKYHSPQSAQITGHAGVHGFTGTTGKTPSSSGPVVGRQSMVPEDWELDWRDQSSSVGAVRGGLVGISSSPARSSPRHPGEGSDSLHRCVQFGLGSPVRLMLDTGTVVSISKIVAHQRSGDEGRHQRCERLPASSEVPGGLLDVRQCSDCGLHQGRSYTLMQMTIRGAIARWSRWFLSICQESTTSRLIPCPELARYWTRSGRWLWSVYEPCSPSGASHRSTCLQHSPTDDSSSLYCRFRTTRGASCMLSRHSMVPQVLQKIAQSPSIRVILIAPLQ